MLDHIQEIVNKWHSMDDEIWAKIICMERNRRIAKAYARQHTISINGSRDDYLDGTTLGLNSFENPDRDSKTSYIKQYIGRGIKIKIYQNGDIFVKRLSRSNVFVHQFKPTENGCSAGQAPLLKGSQSSSDVYALNSSEGGGFDEFYGVVRPKDGKANRRQALLAGSREKSQLARIGLGSKDEKTHSGSSSGASSQSPSPKSGVNHGSGLLLQADKVVRLFSMSKFKQALEFESRKSLPNRARLQNMCISVVSFVMNDQKMLNLPSWVMIINIVAMDLLSSEIGLIEPYDLLPQTRAIAGEAADHWGILKMQHNRLRANRPFDCFEDHDYENDDDNDNEEEDYDGCQTNNELSCRELNVFLSSRNKARRANYGDFGALGMDPVDRMVANHEQFHMYGSDELPSHGHHHGELNHDTTESCLPSNGYFSYLKSQKAYLEEDDQKNSNSDGELTNQTKPNIVQNHRLNSNERPTNAVEQRGSSSSGFIGSHQNDDTSGNSSSSNITCSDRPITAAKVSLSAVLKSSRLRQKMLASKAAIPATTDHNSAVQEHNQVPTAECQRRGKRAQKLHAPHGAFSSGLGSLSSENESPPVIMSEPISIPAPPTSAGGPSGKANLILVSPTGLSPPTTKKLHANEAQQFQDQPGKYSGVLEGIGGGRHRVSEPKYNRLPPLQAPNQVKQTLKLPQGIPAHAQLAPPSARKHILRYLMSASGGRAASELGGARQRQQQQPLSAPLMTRSRVQRPLPGLPGLRHPQQSDESLYYRGLQARAMQARVHRTQTRNRNQHQLAPVHRVQRQMAPPPPPPPPAPLDVTNIMSNFKNNALFRQQLAKHSHQQHLTSEASCRLAATGQDKQQQSQGKANAASKSTGDNLETRRRANELRKPYMRSLDSIHVKTAPNSNRFHVTSFSTSLKSVGNLLRGAGSKTKRPLPNARASNIGEPSGDDYKL